MKPNEAIVYPQLAGFYQRQRDFEKLISAVQQRAELEPNSPEAHYGVATYYWDEAYRNTRLTDAQKRDYVTNGLTAVDKAIALNPEYVEAITYRGLLLRLEAAMEQDAGRQKALLSEANQLQEKAVGLTKKQAAGA